MLRWSGGLSLFTVGVAVGAFVVTPPAGALPPPAPPVGALPQAPPGALPQAPPLAASPGTALLSGPARVVRAEQVSREIKGTAGSGTPAAVPASPRPAAPVKGNQAAASRVRGHRGTLIVNSTPEGAEVFVNNQLAGSTPLVMRSQPVGSRAVRVRLDGYSAWSRGVRVVANTSTTISAQLTRQD
jgi:hypothetical protein